MPRANVPPGRRSKRSCSSASSWRAPNLSCWATSSIVSPRTARSRARISPIPSSRGISSSRPSTMLVIGAALQKPVLGRSRKVPAQLVGVARFGDGIAKLALDAQRQPKRLGGRGHAPVVAQRVPPSLLHVALPVADQPHLQQGARIVWLHAQRLLDELLRIVQLALAQRANSGRRIRAPGCRIERIADCPLEVADRFGLAPRLAQEPAVVVVDIGVVG